VCASHCAQLLHTILHRTDLIVFPLTLQTITTAPIIVEGASLRFNIINYCMWLSCAYLIYNNILLEISGSHSNINSDSYIFHYGNEFVSHTGNKEIRHFVTTNYDQKYPFATKWHLDPCTHLAATDMGRKLGGCAPLVEGSWVPI